MDNLCVCCGAIIPEGREICPKCEKSADIYWNECAKVAHYDDELRKARQILFDICACMNYSELHNALMSAEKFLNSGDKD